MGDVWDRTMVVLNGRGGMLAGIAIPTLFVPGVVNAALAAYAPPSTATAVVAMLVMVAAAVIALWGQLAIIAAASDPATDRTAAHAQASRRLPAGIGVGLMLAVIVSVAFVPMAGLLVASGLDWQAMSGGTAPAPTAPGYAAFAGLYGAALFVVLLFVGSRLLPLYAVVLHERLGLGAITRCWRLTRRHTWRLFGVVVLFVVVLMVASIAAQSVLGLMLRLILGADAVATVTFLAATAGQAVSTALTVVAVVFSAQLFRAVVARHEALAARAAERREQA